MGYFPRGGGDSINSQISNNLLSTHLHTLYQSTEERFLSEIYFDLEFFHPTHFKMPTHRVDTPVDCCDMGPLSRGPASVHKPCVYDSSFLEAKQSNSTPKPPEVLPAVDESVKKNDFFLT